MKAWVIKRNDGLYWNCHIGWCEDLFLAKFSSTKAMANDDIKYWRLKDCNPVKVRIEEVGE